MGLNMAGAITLVTWQGNNHLPWPLADMAGIAEHDGTTSYHL